MVSKYIFWLGLAEMLFYVSGFIVHAAAGRILGRADYGVYGVIITLTILIASLIGNGIPIAMSKFLSAELTKKPEMIPTIKRTAAISQFILMAIVTALFFFGAPLIAMALHDPSLTPLLRISSFIIPCYAADAYYFYYYTGIHRFNMQSVLKSLRAVLRGALIVALGYFFLLKGFIAGYVFVSLSVFLIALFIDKIFYAKKFPVFSGLEFSAKKLLLYALPITSFLVLYQTMISLNLFFVKSILQDDYITGLFNGAFTIAQIPNYLFYALTIVLLPIVAHSAANEHKEKTAEKITVALRIMTLLLLPIIALIIGYAQPLMVFFFGAEYAAGAATLQFMAFGIGLLTLFYVMSFAFQGAGKVTLPLKVAFFGMLINAALNPFLIKQFGAVGSGLATCVTAIFVTIALFQILKKEFNVTLKISALLKMITASVMIYALTFIFPGGHLLFIVSGAILFALYLALLYAMKELTQDDLNLLKSLLPGLRKKA